MRVKFLFLIIGFLFTVKCFGQNNMSNVIVDANLTFEQALSGLDFPEKIRKQLALVEVHYIGTDGKRHRGQIVINKALAEDVKAIFGELEKIRFPIKSVIPVSEFQWDDEKSMLANNTSGFNYRVIKGTDRLSNHAYGFAVDINPLFNPYVKPNSVEPEGAEYIESRPGTITANSEVVKIFKEHGWNWGGDWSRGKDYQHFEKVPQNNR